MLNRASRTAEGTALHRAAHQLFDRPVVFNDPLAVKLVGSEGRACLSRDSSRFTSAQSANARAFVCVRSRFAEDCLREAVQRGVRQYLLLGAGLDTFAYRNQVADLQVFELDHPATQVLKQERLALAQIPLPETLHFEPIDFERELMVDALQRADFEFEHPAQISWLGVALYLDSDSVLSLLASLMGMLAKGSEVVFDFASPLDKLKPEQRRLFQALAHQAKRLGEPYQSEFEPNTLAAHLTTLGASRIEVLTPEQLNQRYLRGRTDGVALRGPGHIMRMGW